MMQIGYLLAVPRKGLMMYLEKGVLTRGNFKQTSSDINGSASVNIQIDLFLEML